MSKFSMQPFGLRLKNTLSDRGLSQSDLARRMWPGEFTVDARGYEAPKGKDLISKWIKGASVPDARNLKTLSEALNMSVEELAPDLLARDTRNEPKEAELTFVAGRPDSARISINTVVPTDVALKIMALLSAAKSKEN